MLLHHAVRRTALVTMSVGLVLSGLLLGGCSVKELAVRSLVLANEERSRRGVPPVYWDDEAAAKADAWAARMAADGTISHSVITDGIVTGWRVLGENVGTGTSIDGVHRAFMRSPRHRDLLLAGKYTHLGVGVSSRDGYLYVVQVFRG